MSKLQLRFSRIDYILSHMAKYYLDYVFHALADPTRRKILGRLYKKELSVTDIAADYPFSLPTITRHLQVLEKAELVKRTKNGRRHTIYLNQKTLVSASEYINKYTLLESPDRHF